MTPNVLARAVETVEGGGLVLVLLQSIDALHQLAQLAMDAHQRYKTDGMRSRGATVAGRFNGRLLLSLADCQACLALTDRLDVIPLTSGQARPGGDAVVEGSGQRGGGSRDDRALARLRSESAESAPIAALVAKCRTACQARALLKLLDLVTDKTLAATCSVTAARGRGKSAALGLSVAGAIAFGYSNIFCTAPSPENLKTFYEFVVKGLEALDYREHTDYELLRAADPQLRGALVRVCVRRDHRQTVQYVSPTDHLALGQAELLVIDEAAAIPLPIVQRLFGPYLIFLASTVNGYEGTGRSLSLKLVQRLRQEQRPQGQATAAADAVAATPAAGRQLHELSLNEPIRYKSGDPVELWLNRLLCLDAANVHPMQSGCPAPANCELYIVNRDTLFSYHKASEAFLQRLMAIYVAAHYKNSPNDLQMLADAPAHQLFVLLGPLAENSALPEILCVLQVCLEGSIAGKSVSDALGRGRRPTGDLIPWTVAQQFQDNDFPMLSGARVVRIATHPDYQGAGYGTRAISLLREYFEGKFLSLNENDTEKPVDKEMEQGVCLEADSDGAPLPRADLPPLLSRLQERSPLGHGAMHWLGVSYGVTLQLLRFWKRAGMVPVYLRQTASELTGEHTCIMLTALDTQGQPEGRAAWLDEYSSDFRRRLISLLSFAFSSYGTDLALCLLQRSKRYKPVDGQIQDDLSRSELSVHLSDADLRRLDLYARNMADHHLITDLLPTLARLYFGNRISLQSPLSTVQSALLVGVALQHKSVDALAQELRIPVSQALALHNKTVRKLSEHLNAVCERAIDAAAGHDPAAPLKVLAAPAARSLQQDLAEAEAEYESASKKQRKRLESRAVGQPDLSGKGQSQSDLGSYAVRGTDAQWTDALRNVPDPKLAGIVSLPVGDTATPKTTATVSALNQSLGAQHIGAKKSTKGKKKRKRSL